MIALVIQFLAILFIYMNILGMGGIGAVAEPLVVVTLLFIGTWINRDSRLEKSKSRRWRTNRRTGDVLNDLENNPGLMSPESSSNGGSRSMSPSLLDTQDPIWRKRQVGVGKYKIEVTTPNNRRFRHNLLSRVLKRFPFLVECWYWALIYWVYQLGRAASALLMVESTVDVARDHALQVIALEKKLHIFWELDIQRAFMRRPFLMTWINRIYSFIHIPGSIAFLIWLFYNCHRRMNHTSDSSISERQDSKTLSSSSSYGQTNHHHRSITGPNLYQSRRRTMAFSNLLAFAVFTLWPCMPPRLLSSDTANTPNGAVARTYGFVDTVHGTGGESSIWTENRFCNQYAAMPSLHFGYALLVGLTVLTTPLRSEMSDGTSRRDHGHIIRIPLSWLTIRVRVPSWKRAACVVVGIAYPALILVAILATANHFILDAVAGAMVCGIAWWGNGVLVNLLVLEDWFLWFVRMDKPVVGGEDEEEDGLLVD